jgi:hypothetical protein
MNTTYKIVNGPSRSDLFASCERSYDKGTRINLEFFVTVGCTMPEGHPEGAYLELETSDFRISSIEHEDGSGHSFNLKGYCKANLTNIFGKELIPYKFEAYFNTKTREGHITFLD